MAYEAEEIRDFQRRVFLFLWMVSSLLFESESYLGDESCGEEGKGVSPLRRKTFCRWIKGACTGKCNSFDEHLSSMKRRATYRKKPYLKKWTVKNRDRLCYKKRLESKNLRFEIINQYGGYCSCCGESEISFLTIDHVNGDGAAHRKAVCGTKNGRSSSIYKDIKNRGFPIGPYQVLCMNCNFATRFKEECPHSKKGISEFLNLRKAS